ncbi:beta-ketoacyl synthase N-terminal-like domain-containing protein [Gillisia limnaea]|uniref:Beta-ketoacyl synthase n=1 Tax=Gillisia limnaea (strain DSM 15749 / LMG 21470 / R-8282) TaxID=865937 RepID=H2BS06_GILLR|nr:beta-ketoacyl synthase N-terminal-like domain-containing protein [Gillisia limnaea]EHQ02493.1 Beta-ketoacyl synthase [Gillisia limnaea DSM 15749]
MKTPVYITSIASVSPLGKTSEEIWKNYKDPNHLISRHDFNGKAEYAAFLPKKLKEEIEQLQASQPHFKNLDESVLYAIFASREAVKRSGWGSGGNIGINIGSSRGATQLFEKYHTSFLNTGKAEILASPSTTLGNISSWVAQDLQSSGPEISHSVTCSTGLHAILNGIAWLQAGMADKFLVGGSEAALTPFTIAQMKAMKIYASQDLDFPCRALDMEKTRNSMILGEAAGVLCLENNSEKSIAKIGGIGYATEKLKHSVSISANADCFQKSMKMAIGTIPLDEIDVVVMHAPGTQKGDKAEVNAIRELFGKLHPALTSNKWKIGHTFGASGILSLELAILMLQHQEFIPVPFSEFQKAPNQVRNILVNAVGFGGNAVSILVNKS